MVDDAEAMRERIATTVTSLLGLVGIEADPVQSREFILLSTIIDFLWRQGDDLDLAQLITQVQNPPVSKIGVLDLESFYPSKDRFALVMALNNLLASPGFQRLVGGRAVRYRLDSLHSRRQAARGDILHCPSERCPAHVFRLVAAQPGAWLDACPTRHDQPARLALHRRALRLHAPAQ